MAAIAPMGRSYDLSTKIDLGFEVGPGIGM
jgi:hypothetical protein